MASSRGLRAVTSRRELAAVLIIGAAGAGTVLLASRQALARVVVMAPAPLPPSVTEVSAQDLRPAIGALAVAALASLAAVLATRGPLRRITGVVTAALGAAAGLVSVGRITAAQALAAAKTAGLSSLAGQGAGTSPGSVSAGGTGQGAGPGLQISGMPVHVTAAGPGWRVVLIVGAVLLVVAGLAVLVRSDRLPAMSARYERHARPRRRGLSSTAMLNAAPDVPNAAQAGQKTSQTALWEALSAGEDPTA